MDLDEIWYCVLTGFICKIMSIISKTWGSQGDVNSSYGFLICDAM